MLTKFSESLYLDVDSVISVELRFTNSIDLHISTRQSEVYWVPGFASEAQDAVAKLAEIVAKANSGSANSTEAAALTSALAARQVEIEKLMVSLAQCDAEIEELKERLAAVSQITPDQPRESKAWDLTLHDSTANGTPR